MLSKSVLVTFGALVALAFLLLVAMAFIAPRSLEWNSVVAFVGYFLFSMSSFRLLRDRFSKQCVLVLLLASMLTVQAYTVYLYFVEPPVSMPILLVYSLAIVSAFFLQQTRTLMKFVPMLVSIVFLCFMFLSGWASWTEYIRAGIRA